MYLNGVVIETKIIRISVKHNLLLCCYIHLGNTFRLIFKSSSDPFFFKKRSLLSTLTMHYGIPTTYSFCIICCRGVGNISSITLIESLFIHF